MIVLLRVDERLIHGQIVVAWCKTLKITHIVAANDEIMNHEIQRDALQMAVPHDVKLAICGVSRAIEVAKDSRLAEKRVMIVTKTVKDALTMVDSIPEIPYVNIGNVGLIGRKEGVTEYLTNIRLSSEDIEDLKKIETRVPVELQMTPDSEKKTMATINRRK